jgi:hypothetical protein
LPSEQQELEKHYKRTLLPPVSAKAK